MGSAYFKLRCDILCYVVLLLLPCEQCCVTQSSFRLAPLMLCIALVIIINSRRACAARVTVVVWCVCVCVCVCHCMCVCACVCVCVCVCVLCVCVYMSVRSFLPPRASRPRNIGNVGTYGFTVKRKTFTILIFTKNSSFRNYGVVCLP